MFTVIIIAGTHTVCNEGMHHTINIDNTVTANLCYFVTGLQCSSQGIHSARQLQTVGLDIQKTGVLKMEQQWTMHWGLAIGPKHLSQSCGDRSLGASEWVWGQCCCSLQFARTALHYFIHAAVTWAPSELWKLNQSFYLRICNGFKQSWQCSVLACMCITFMLKIKLGPG